MSNLVTELYIVENDKTIFNSDMNYVIPLYQRAYAWEDKQLIQLIEDICDVSKDVNYYIGSLIVSEQNNAFEVVDGQQRLTSLFILLNCLGYDVPNTLTFACREKSNYTLTHIQDLINEDRGILDLDRIEQGIQNGIKILKQTIANNGVEEKLRDNLSRVVVYRIEVPDNTDLNRYFEIMNTRGEQLEQHDILKATLMSYLSDEQDKSLFAEIWDACSDMTGYVQMHFTSKQNTVREAIFGDYWSEIPSKHWDDYKKGIEWGAINGQELTLAKITERNFTVESFDGNLDDKTRVRFESIIDFPYFLLHVLKVYVSLNHIFHEDGLKIMDDLLDDKRLLDSFNRVVSYGVNKEGRIKENKEAFSKGFIVSLLRTRFLFDQYVIKREYKNENSDGDWSLKALYVSGKGTGKKPYYYNTMFVRKGEHYQDWKSNTRNKQNIMIQSALRVSFTSPKVMHWITQLLIWLSENEEEEKIGFYEVAEDIARKAVREQFFDVSRDGIYEMGVNTPHIVFNYLDYLLWKDNVENYNDFSFEFRNSVEHWYPQHPSEGSFDPWTDGVDRFGNLCIIQRNVNSRFSNMSPEAKKSTFEKMISKGSLKLRLMSELTTVNDGTNASQNWKDNVCKEHEEEMINILKDSCCSENQ